MNITKSHGVLVDYDSEDNDSFIETKSYAESCQLIMSLIKGGEIVDGCVVIRYRSEDGVSIQ